MQLCHRSRLALLGIFLAASLGGPSGTALAADDGEFELRGLISARFANAWQQGSLDDGGDLDDSQGIDTAIGFRAGEYFAFSLGWEWQTDDDFDTHYFPANFRFYSPALLERVRLYATTGMGLLFTRTHDSFNPNGDDRAAAFHAGGGLQIEITEEIGLLWYAKYNRGLGSADDFESVVHGVGLQYSWGL